MFRGLAKKVPSTTKLPQRVNDIEVLKQILMGTIYDNLNYEFHEERDNRGKVIPMYARSPAVDVGIGLIKNTVNHTISFVFGEGRFPEVTCEDEPTRNALSEIINDANLPQVMQDAMYWGSLGSVAIHVKMSMTNRIHFKVYCSQFLTPTWSQDDPDVLVGMQEKYIVTGADLAELGYDIDPQTYRQQYYFMRQWDDTWETWFIPWPVVNNDKVKTVPQIDNGPNKTTKHDLGFIPWVWIKNLRGGDDIDGLSTFQAGIKTCIEIDYLVSQGDRGLKYQADPTLVIIDPQADPKQPIFRSAAQAIMLGKDGKAEILEMKGTAHGALLEQVRQLREFALEAMGGNRSSPDKLQAAQSGAALELLWQPVIMLAGDLRNAYGENGLLTLLNMVLQIGSNKRIMIDKEPLPLLKTEFRLSLTWPDYFEPTLPDMQAKAATLIQLTGAGLMSKDSAVRIIAAGYDIDDAEEELKNIQQEADTAMDDRVTEAKQMEAIKPKKAVNG